MLKNIGASDSEIVHIIDSDSLLQKSSGICCISQCDFIMAA